MSCPSTTFCMAVGSYRSGGNPFPLVYTWGNGPLIQQNAPLKPFEQGHLNDVSCQSCTFYVAVGANLLPAAPVGVWNGSGFTECLLASG